MQTIGKMEDGRVVAVLSFLENDILAMIGTMIELQGLEKACAQPAAPAAKIRPIRPISPNASAAGIPAKAHPWRAAIAAEVEAKTTARSALREAATAGRGGATTKPCAWCGKPLGKNQGPLATTHTGECQKLYRRKQAREAWRVNHKVKNPHKNLKEPSTETVNPSSPFLTDEQRKEVMARREKLIAESAQRHAHD